MTMYKGKFAKIIQFVVIAALYAGLTITEQFTVGMTKDIIQVRLSDALLILPVFTPAAIPGLFAGCLISNYVIGCHIYDVIFGSVATLIGAIGTYLVRKHKFMAPVPPIIINMIVIPILFAYVYRYENPFWYFVVAIGVGELIACGVLGIALMLGLEDHKDSLFPGNDLKSSDKRSAADKENKETTMQQEIK